MKNVLFVVDERRMGGVSVLLRDILRFINKDKYQIDVMVLDNNGDYLDDLDSRINLIYGTPFFKVVDYSLKEVIKSKKINLIIRKLYLIFLLKTKLIKRKIVKERCKCLTKKYDVEVAFKDGITAVFTAYGDSLKKYHWLHTDYSKYDASHNYKNLFKEVFLKFDKIIAISEGVKKEFLKLYEARDTEVIYNLIDVKKIKQDSLKENIEYDKDKLNLISIGRIHPMKGYDRLIEVLHELDNNSKLDNVVVRLIGSGPDDWLIKDLISKYKLEDKVLFLGPKKNPYPYLLKSDCFLMCSRYEPFGLVILESLTLKVPVLSLEELSIHEIMNKKYGIIVENSSKGLYNGILDIIENKNKLQKLKNNLENYSYDVNDIIKKIEYLLDE